MTPAAYREALGALGLTQARFGRLIGADKNTPVRWGLGQRPIPPAVAVLLGAMVEGRVTIGDVERLAA